jgi:lactate racemase
MTTTLRYGDKHVLELNLPADRLIARCGVADAPVLSDVTATTAAALAAPLDFPPLARAVVPGDHVVLALDHDVPRGREIVAALFDCLVAQQVNPADITLLTVAPLHPVGDLHDLLPAAHRDQATLAVHNPDARDQLGYLAVGADDDPIYLNRLLCDADMVVPIGCLRCEPAIDYHGMYGGLFPTFSGRATQDKLFARVLTHAEREEARSREKIQEVGWLLGVQFTVQVIPGSAGEVLQVLAGNANEVFRQGQAECQRAWSAGVPRAAKLVVAAIDGPASEQTWDNMARALTSAARLVAADGAIALCTTIAHPPGPTMKQVSEMKDRRGALKSLHRHRAADSLPAVALAEALAQTRVYLLSELEESVVEELGMTPLASAAQLARLADRHASCIMLSNAQYAVATVDGE